MKTKIFISYSWTTQEHEIWVINLAQRLMSDGVEVVIDKWDLKEGNDMYTFMESMVNSTDVSKVLIILDKKYTEKANSRSGGVGTETQIISPTIYKNLNQEKFIPIVAERDSDGSAFIPTFLDGRIYIDFSSNQQLEDNYETLLRNIYNRPTFSKPKLGTPPSYLFEDTPMNFKTSQLLRSFDSQIDKHPNRINNLIRDFLDIFLLNLKEFKVTFGNRNEFDIGKLICDNIHQYTPLRNDFILFFDKLTKLNILFDIDTITSFLEKLPNLTFLEEGQGSVSYGFEYANFKFIIHELFIYLVSIGLKNENYKFIEDILYSNYFPHDRYDRSNKAKTYESFYTYMDAINAYYNQVNSQKFLSPMADLMIKRVPEFFPQKKFVEADLICHHVGILNNIKWFPITYIYEEPYKLELFYKMESLRHFEKVKNIFGVNKPSELKENLVKLKENYKDYDRMKHTNSFNSVVPIFTIIDIEKIGTIR
jgi:TIR domain